MQTAFWLLENAGRVLEGTFEFIGTARGEMRMDMNVNNPREVPEPWPEPNAVEKLALRISDFGKHVVGFAQGRQVF